MCRNGIASASLRHVVAGVVSAYWRYQRPRASRTPAAAHQRVVSACRYGRRRHGDASARPRWKRETRPRTLVDARCCRRCAAHSCHACCGAGSKESRRYAQNSRSHALHGAIRSGGSVSCACGLQHLLQTRNHHDIKRDCCSGDGMKHWSLRPNSR